jgi:hypothetical protein
MSVSPDRLTAFSAVLFAQAYTPPVIVYAEIKPVGRAFRIGYPACVMGRNGLDKTKAGQPAT